MPLFRHKGHHGGRYDDPHGVTAPVKKAMPLSGTPEKIQIDTTPKPLPELSKKEQKRKAKGLKEINSPKSRAQGARKNEMYQRAKAAEERRSEPASPDKYKPGPDKAFVEGGFKGMDKYDKETSGGKLLTPGDHRMAAKNEAAEYEKKRDRFFS